MTDTVTATVIGAVIVIACIGPILAVFGIVCRIYGAST